MSKAVNDIGEALRGLRLDTRIELHDPAAK